MIGCVGFFGSNFLAERQEKETNLRLYTELMSKREESDTSLRKEMFNSIITNFLKPTASARPEDTVLNLELLAYNFHDSLDLEPLFKDVYKKLDPNRPQHGPYINRLKRVTKEVIDKQVAMLAEAGGRQNVTVNFPEIQAGGVTVFDDFIESRPGVAKPAPRKRVKIEVLSAYPERQELFVRLLVGDSQEKLDVDEIFTVGFFDFPMLDNVRLSEGLRCAIVLDDFQEEFAAITLVYFPGERASLKEKPYYDEILSKLRAQPSN